MKDSAVHNIINLMTKKGYLLKTVYDIGACQGIWSKEVKNHIFPDADFYLFEANPAYNNLLSNSGFTVFNVVLSSPNKGPVKFYSGCNSGDSYYRENTKWYDNSPVIEADTFTLDFLISENNLPQPNFIKIDTQGSEIDILQGAESIIHNVDMILTECPITEYNIGAPNIQEYLDFFKSKNFIPVTLNTAHVMENILVQIDILFMKKDIKEKYLYPTQNIRF